MERVEKGKRWKKREETSGKEYKKKRVARGDGLAGKKKEKKKKLYDW